MKFFNLKQLVSIDYVPSKKMDLVYIPALEKTIKEGKWYQKKKNKNITIGKPGYHNSLFIKFGWDGCFSDVMEKNIISIENIENNKDNSNYPYHERIIDETLNRRILFKKSHVVFIFSNNDKEILYFNTRREAKWYISDFILRNKSVSKTLKQFKLKDSDYDYTE